MEYVKRCTTVLKIIRDQSTWFTEFTSLGATGVGGRDLKIGSASGPTKIGIDGPGSARPSLGGGLGEGDVELKFRVACGPTEMGRDRPGSRRPSLGGGLGEGELDVKL